MESSHANNAGLAKFINDCLYDTKNPAQQKKSNYRNTICGFPILLYINDEFKGVYNFNLDRYSLNSFGYSENRQCICYEVSANSDTTAGAFHKWTSSSGKTEIDYYKSDFEAIYPPDRVAGNDTFDEIIRLVTWVNDASDELFKEQIHEYFNLEYLLRYFLTVMVFGLVDSLGKNMKLCSWDRNIWYPMFYDMDTALGLDNTGYLEFDSDIEVQPGIFNTSGSKLWTKVQRVFHAELKEQYSLMRLDRFTEDNIMKYLYGEQVSQIPERNYNIDMQTKYLNFGTSYLYACHGNRLQHMKKWIRERLVYCDTLMEYLGSTSDYITLRANKLGKVYLDLATYIPMYLRVKWRDEANNAGVQVKRVGRGETVRFEYSMPTETDQEVIIYASRYLKSIGDVSNLKPSTMLIANATKLTSITCSSPNLTNTDLSKLVNLQHVDLHDCTKLGTGIGSQPTLNLADCRYLKTINLAGTKVTAVYTNLSGGSIEEIIYPESTQSINLRNQARLRVVGIPFGYHNILDKFSIEYGKIFRPELQEMLLSNEIIEESEHQSILYTEYVKVDSSKVYSIYVHGRYDTAPFDLKVALALYDKDKTYIKQVYKVLRVEEHEGAKIDFNLSKHTDAIYGRLSVEFTSNVEDPNTYPFAKEKLNEMITFSTEDKANVFQECVSLANVDIQNCPNVERLSDVQQFPGVDTFLALKHVQKLYLKNSLGIRNMNFASFQRLKDVTLSDLATLESCGFDDMNNIGDTGTLNNIVIANCPSIRDLTFNVSSDEKCIMFSNNSTLDLSQAYTLESITANTPIIGLKTIILPLGMQNLHFSNEFSSDWDSDIKNLWSYSSKAENDSDGYTGIDFKDISIKDIDLTATKKIPDSKNMNVAPINTFKINESRDGVTYPYMNINGTVDLSNYTGSLANAFKGLDLSKTTFICNKDLTQTDFTSMFEDAIFGEDTDITPILNRIKTPTTLDRMFKGSNIRNVINIPNITTRHSRNSMYENCSNITSIDNIEINNRVTSCSSMFKGCTSLTSANNVHIRAIGSCSDIFKNTSLSQIAGLSFTDTTNLSGAFQNTKITSCSLSIPNTCTDISMMFKECSFLTSIDNMVFGSGITEYNDFMEKDGSVLTADNLIINSDILINGIFFSNNTIRSIQNLKIGPNVTMLSNAFRMMRDLEIMTFSDEVFDSNITAIDYIFYFARKLHTFSFGGITLKKCSRLAQPFNSTRLTRIVMPELSDSVSFYGFILDTAVEEIEFYPKTINFNLIDVAFNSPNIRIIENLKIGMVSIVPNKDNEKPFYNCTALEETPGLELLSDNAVKIFKGGRVKKISEVTFGSNITNISGMFENCTNLECDIDIPTHITNATNCFKNCSKLTHATSNWSKSYDREITANGCYSGCLAITHIDNSNVIDYDGDLGLDDIPESWGGNGFLPHETDVYVFDVSELDNYNLGWGNVQALTLGVTNWGDGTIDSERSHTYREPGSYVVKTKSWISGKGYGPDSRIKNSLIEVKQLKYSEDPSEEYNYSFSFDGCIKLRRADVSSLKYLFTITSMFVRCSNLTYVKLPELLHKGSEYEHISIDSLFNGCSSLNTIENIEALNNQYVTSFNALFAGCESLTSFDIGHWDTSNIKNMEGMFKNTGINNIEFINNWNLTNVTNIKSMFQYCASLKTISNLNWDFPNVGTVDHLFGNTGIVNADLRGIRFGNKLESLYYFLGHCDYLETVDVTGLNVTSATSLYCCFGYCSELKTVNGLDTWDTSNIRDLSYLFHYGHSLENATGIEGWDVSKVVEMNNLFRSCQKLTSLDLSRWNVESLKSLSHAFNDCRALRTLNLTGWKTNPLMNNPQHWENALTGCRKLSNNPIEGFADVRYIPLLSFSGANDAFPQRVDFSSCGQFENLTSIEFPVRVEEVVGLRSTSKFKASFRYSNRIRVFENLRPRFGGQYDYFYYEPPINEIKIIFEGEITKDDNLEDLFHVNAEKNYSAVSKFTQESLVSLLNILKDYSGTGFNPILDLGSIAKSKLTPEQITIATNKNWSVV